MQLEILLESDPLGNLIFYFGQCDERKSGNLDEMASVLLFQPSESLTWEDNPNDSR